MSFLETTHGETGTDVLVRVSIDTDGSDEAVSIIMLAEGSREAIPDALVTFSADTLNAFISALESARALLDDCKSHDH
jgi:hypothetical protein